MSLVSRGARAQFAVGIALISVIPLLAFLCFNVTDGFGETATIYQNLFVVILLTTAAGSGYVILQKYPVNIVRLRGYLERVISGELPEQVLLFKGEDDIVVVERCLNLILERLKERLELRRKRNRSNNSSTKPRKWRAWV